MKQILIASLLGLASCSNSGPINIGKDTYSVTVRVPFSGSAGAKSEALKEASSYCEGLNKHVQLKNKQANECMLRGGCGEAEVIFQCLDENDPRYSNNFQMRKDNGVSTIEIR